MSVWMHSLQQGLGLAGWIVWMIVLELLHLLLQGQELTLQLTAQPRQRVPDVVGQLLQNKQTNTMSRESTL